MTTAANAQRRAQLEKHTLPFLACLLGCSLEDAWVQPVTFQTFSDVKPKGKDPLARVLHGSLDDLAEELERLNQAGAGIFVSVNKTDLKGRSKVNITALHGYHADLDRNKAEGTFDAQAALAAMPLESTMDVGTPGGIHPYWLTTQPMPCDGKERRLEHEAELKAIQNVLKDHGADRAACTVERVLRVPGFMHCKAEPRLVELLKANGPRYIREQIQKAFPPEETKPKSAPAPAPRPADLDRGEVLARAGAYLDKLPGSTAGAGGNADGGTKTFTDALKVITGFDLTEEEALALFRDHYNARCEPPWSEADLRHKVCTAWQAARAAENRGHMLDDHGRPFVPGFVWDERGLHHVKLVADGHGGHTTVHEWIAPPFTLPGRARDANSHGWALLMAWRDPDSIEHEEQIPLELLSGDGAELFRILCQGGMAISPKIALRHLLLQYLFGAAAKVNDRVRLVDRLGWHEGAFVLPRGEVIGDAREPLRFAGETHGASLRGVRGTLEAWQEGVARYAVGNPYLAFSMACAFAGPLLKLVRPDGGGGFNLMGSSSKGKTTCLEAAASVCGSPEEVPTWRATSNGLEGIAVTRNDGFLPLDELSQVDPREAGQVAYMLANGAAKMRMTKDGGNRPIKQWRLIFLSSGEQSLEDKVNEDGRRVRAGQEVRVPDIPFPTEGLFVDAHGMAGFGEFAEHLKTQARENYGVAIRAFLKALCTMRCDDAGGLESGMHEFEKIWLNTAVPSHADGQVRRVAGRFALVAVAGELARELGVLPWPQGEAARAALVCFKAWLERRGHIGASERERGLQSVVDFLQTHGLSRFADWDDAQARPANMAGVRRKVHGKPVATKYRDGIPPVEGWDFYLSPTGWREACKEFNRQTVALDAIEDGLLEPGPKGRGYLKMRTPHCEGQFYVIRGKALGAFRAEGA